MTVELSKPNPPHQKRCLDCGNRKPDVDLYQTCDFCKRKRRST